MVSLSDYIYSLKEKTVDNGVRSERRRKKCDLYPITK